MSGHSKHVHTIEATAVEGMETIDRKIAQLKLTSSFFFTEGGANIRRDLTGPLEYWSNIWTEKV